MIGLQEGWDKDKMKAVLSATDDRRKQLGLTPFYFEGPPDVAGGIFKDILRSAIQEVEGGDEGSNGGVWTLSKNPIGPHDFHIYSADACKGEDCFKAKAVLWTRIMLNAPSPTNTGCTSAGMVLGGSRCKPPPSGGDFIDVFNTHLNATDTSLCSDDVKRAFVLGLVSAGIGIPGIGALAVRFLNDIYNNDLNCGLPDDVIQRRQLVELNAFIESHAAKDRPSVILGDFNIDGRKLDPSGGSAQSQYREMIRLLHIGPVSSYDLYGNRADENDDMANPWPLDFDWDVDHGDLARDAFTPYPVDGKCMGTFIGANVDEVDYRNECPYADFSDGHLRYDYIFVRPPYQADDPNFEAAKWVAERVPDQSWHSPYPGPPPTGKTFSGPPDRLSDHKPVLVGLEHAKLVVAPKFHPNWRHDLELRVASYDASDRGDCWGCGNLDPYVSRSALYRDQANDVHWVLQTNHSSTCDSMASNSYSPAGCMADWNVKFPHEGTELVHAFGSALFDEDDGVWGISDDPLYLRNGGTQPVMWVFWGVPTWIGLRGWEGQSMDTVDWPVADTEPVPIATTVPGAGGPTNQCLLFSAKELPPGQQF